MLPSQWELYEHFDANASSQQRVAVLVMYLLIAFNFTATGVAILATLISYGDTRVSEALSTKNSELAPAPFAQCLLK